MSTVRLELVVAALLAGTVALGLATRLATRHEPAVRGARLRGLSPVVPWLGSVLVVVLLLRGSYPAALVVGVATVGHALVARWRLLARRR